MTSLNISYCLLVAGHGVTTVTRPELSFNLSVSGHQTEICAGLKKVFATCIRTPPVQTLSVVIPCGEDPLQHSDLELDFK